MFQGYGSTKQCDSTLNALWDLEHQQSIAEVIQLFARSK
jgi:hypothetical protein